MGRLRAISLAAPLLALAVMACRPRGVRDLDGRNPRSTFGAAAGTAPAPAPAPAASSSASQPSGAAPRILVRATSRAVAAHGDLVLYGDAAEDGLYAIPKHGGAAVRLGPRAPVTGGLGVAGAHVVWVGTPGDTVLRRPLDAPGARAEIVRERGMFGNVVGGAGVWLTEARGAGGVLVEVGAAVTTGTTFEGAPRGLARAGDDVVVATTTGLLATAHGRGEPELLGAGAGLASPVATALGVFVTVANGATRALVRYPLGEAGAPSVVATAVRDAPIAVHASRLYAFDAERPALLAWPLAGGAPTTVAEDPSFERVTALAVDGDGALVATGGGDEGVIEIVPLR